MPGQAQNSSQPWLQWKIAKYSSLKTATALLVPRGVEFLIRDESAPEDEQFLDFYASRLSPTETSRMEDRRTSIPETRPQRRSFFLSANRPHRSPDTRRGQPPWAWWPTCS